MHYLIRTYFKERDNYDLHMKSSHVHLFCTFNERRFKHTKKEL